MYYLTLKAKCWNAKKHIIGKYDDLEQAKRRFDLLNNKRYIYEIVNGKWETIEKKGE